MKRILDTKTMTYAFPDGSGRITKEAVVERQLLKSRIQEIESSDKPFPLGLLALLRFKYFTLHSK